MANFTEVDTFSEDLANKIHDLNTDVFKWVLSNTLPTVGATFLLSQAAQIATGGGYTQMTDGAGGLAVTVTFTRTGQTTTVSGNLTVLTATGTVNTFRYLLLVNDTPTAGGGAGAPGPNPVIGFLDHGSPVNMGNTDTYTIPAGAYFTIN